MQLEPRDKFADITERILYLRAIPVAADLPPPVLKIIATQLRERTFEKGAYLMREGEPIDALHFLITGKLTLTRKGKPFGALTPPQSLGFLGILARGEGTYDAIAEEEIVSLALDAEAISELLEDHYELLVSTVRYLCERILAELKEMPPGELGGRLDGEGIEIPEGPLSLLDRIVFYKRLRAFRATNLSSITMMAKPSTEVRLKAGERYWSAGDAAQGTLFTAAGRVQCVAPDGRVWGAGAFAALGGIESVASQPRWYHLEAVTDVLAFWLPVQVFEEVLEDDFALAQGFYSNAAAQLVELLERNVARGASTLGALRNVSRLGAVPVGA